MISKRGKVMIENLYYKVTEPKPYPKLMSTENGTVVLFTSDKCGTQLTKSDNPSNVGSYDTDWDMSQFTDLIDSLTLENE